MKSSTKALIAFIVLAVIGLGLTVGGAIMEKEFFIDLAKSIADPTYGYNTTEYLEQDGQNISSFEINVKAAKVSVVSGDNFSLKATTKNTTVEQSVENGVFKFTEAHKSNFLSFFNNQNSYVLTLPTEKKMDLQVGNKSGDVIISNCSNIGNLTVNLSSGDIEIEKTKAEAIKTVSLSGTTDLNTVQGTSLNMANSSGKIILTEITINGNIDISQKSGKVFAEGIKSSNLTIENTSGKTEIIKSEIQNALKIKNLSGSILVDSLTKCNMDLQTVSGDVIIKLIDDQINIEASCVSGKVEFCGEKKGTKFNHNVSSQYKIFAKTTSGDVEIYIK